MSTKLDQLKADVEAAQRAYDEASSALAAARRVLRDAQHAFIDQLIAEKAETEAQS